MAISLRAADIRLPVATPVPGQRPAMLSLAARIAELTDALPEQELPEAVALALKPFLGQPDLLDRRHAQGDAEHYRRHLLYADPLRRFTLLSLVWAQGQHTPVHGHTAWGAVGIHRGRLQARHYELIKTGGGLLACSERLYSEGVTGDTSFVKAGLGDLHRLACQHGEGAVSIHVYGRDLSQDPGSINIALPH